MSGLKNNVWKTFNGREIPVNKLEREHLSNIFWYYLICHNTKLDWVIDELKTRFNGQPGQYLPHVDHAHELQLLEEMGILEWRNKAKEAIEIGELTYEGMLVGVIWRFHS